MDIPIFSLLLNVGLCVTTVFAHQDRLGRISRAELTCEDGQTIVSTTDCVSVLADHLGKISRATLTFQDGGTAVITADGVSLRTLALQTESGTVEVRKEDLADIDFPRFDTMEMTWGTFQPLWEIPGIPDPHPELRGVAYRCIRLRFGGEAKKSFGELPEVIFKFYNDKYHHRAFEKKVSKDSWILGS